VCTAAALVCGCQRAPESLWLVLDYVLCALLRRLYVAVSAPVCAFGLS
jgi:hypothetical protein